MTFLSWISSKMPTSLSFETFNKLTQPLENCSPFNILFELYTVRHSINEDCRHDGVQRLKRLVKVLTALANKTLSKFLKKKIRGK